MQHQMTKQKIIDAFNFRHACKTFDPARTIPHDDMQFILETARLSPSSFGFEPWQFIVVQDASLREKLKAGAWGATIKLETASHFVVCLAMKATLIRHDSLYIQDFMKNVQLLPEDIITTKSQLYAQFQTSDFDLSDDRKLFDWACKQSYIPLANMMSAAAMIGIDSCPIEGFKQAETNQILQQDFGVDIRQYGIAYMVAFGYRANAPKPKTRRTTNQVVSWR